ncbi:MAG TPA: hypothetical protein VFH45_11180 [Acidimicrobiales bacterium]|nr:hypothetical protein [Acidimicrobiales bacterium]
MNAARRARAGGLLRAKWPLIAVCVSVAVVEAALLEGLGATWVARLAPQVVAPAPFGAFHDLRWLVVYHDSWLTFALGLAALLVFRSLLDAVLVRLAWPEDLEAPSLLAAWRQTAAFTAVTVVLLAPWVTLLFGLAVVSLSWLFFAAVPPVLAVAVLTNPGAVTGDWWRRTVPLRAVGWAALTFLVMTVASGVVSIDPPALAVPVAALGALFNAWAWRGVVSAVAGRRAGRFAPVAPAGLFGLLVVAVVGAFIGFTVGGAQANAARLRSEKREAPPPSNGAPVIIASGFGTRWDGRSGPWLDGPFDEQRFSYRGLDGAGRPLAYDSADTTQSLDSLDAKMAAQVDVLWNRTHRPVSLVAVSEGSLVAETYLARYPHAPVSKLVVVSPLVRPGRVYYPPGGGEGFGMVGGLGLQALSDALDALSPFRVSPGTPLFQSIVTEAPAVRSLFACPPPGVSQVAILPLADAVASPGDGAVGTADVVVPAFHSGALGDPNVDVAVADVLQHRGLPGGNGWSFFERWLRPASAAWQVPELAATVNPAWVLPLSGVDGDGSLSCAAVRTMLAPAHTTPTTTVR